MSKAFTAPVDKAYLFDLTFEFPSIEARLNDQIVGTRFDKFCKGDVKYQDIPEAQREGLGRPMSFQIVIRRANDRSVLVDQTSNSLCLMSSGDNTKSRIIGWVELPRGNYIAEVTNLESQRDFSNVMTYISMVAGVGK